VSPKRNDPAPIPTLPDEWKLILGTTDAAKMDKTLALAKQIYP